jgi:hypothetical protein
MSASKMQSTCTVMRTAAALLIIWSADLLPTKHESCLCLLVLHCFLHGCLLALAELHLQFRAFDCACAPHGRACQLPDFAVACAPGITRAFVQARRLTDAAYQNDSTKASYNEPDAPSGLDRGILVAIIIPTAVIITCACGLVCFVCCCGAAAWRRLHRRGGGGSGGSDNATRPSA